LIEDSVPVNREFIGNYIRFNRINPQAAINEINRRMQPAQPASSKNADDIVPWLLGGSALLAVLNLYGSKR
jgi:hypothetical protein